MAESDLPRIGAPAVRALASIGVTRIDQLVEQSRAELLALHGVGPRALRIIDEALADRGESMRS
jgi:endonuclease III